MTQSNRIRATYDRRWQGIIHELVAQREQHQREILALNARLTVVAKELVWHKYVAFLPFVLVLLCFGYVLSTRSRPMQPMMNKVPGAFSWAGFNRSAAAPLPRNRMPATFFRKRTHRSTSELKQTDVGALPIVYVRALRMEDNQRIRLEPPTSLTNMNDENYYDDDDDAEVSCDEDLLMDIDD